MAIGETSGIEKNMKVSEAVDEYLLATFGADDDTVKKASDPTKAVVGVFQGKAAASGKVNVMLTGVSLVKLGAAVSRGDLVTTDAEGKGKKTATARNYVVGIAVASGADGDIIPVLLSQSII